jgi:predicted DNA-binding transcriptional regulator AlpA
MTVRLLTTEEVADRFRTSPATVRYWRHIGIGPAGVRVGRRVLYDEAECDRWWESKVANNDRCSTCACHRRSALSFARGRLTHG